MYTSLTLLYTIFEGLRGKSRLSTIPVFSLSRGLSLSRGWVPGPRTQPRLRLNPDWDSTPSSSLFKWVERKVSRLRPIQSSVLSRGWVHSRLSPSRGWVHSGLSPSRGWVHSGFSPFGVQSHSGFSPIRGRVYSGLSPIRGSVHSGLSPVRGWVHSRFSPFEVESF